MANTSDWKGFERDVAEALGGRRLHRTMGSYSTEAPDVIFTRKQKRKFQKLKRVAVECKKRRSINVHKFFSEAKLKYGRKGKTIVLASKIPATQKAAVKWKRLQKALKKKLGIKLRRKDFILPLVTVELNFFAELWRAWLKEKEE